LRLDNFKLTPGQLHLAGGQRKVDSVAPFGLDQPPRLKSQQVLDSEIAKRDRDIELNGKPRDLRSKSRCICVDICVLGCRNRDQRVFRLRGNSKLSPGRCNIFLRALNLRSWRCCDASWLSVRRGRFRTLVRLTRNAGGLRCSHTERKGAATGPEVRQMDWNGLRIARRLAASPIRSDTETYFADTLEVAAGTDFACPHGGGSVRDRGRRKCLK